MGKTILRLMAVLLCLCMAGLAPAAYAASSDMAGTVRDYRTMDFGEVTKEDLAMMDRFGSDVAVTLGADGEPVLVNGYELRTVRAGFNNLDQDTSFQYELDFLDYPFWNPATEYDGNLAVMSLAMALSANRAVGFEDTPEEDFDPALNLEHFLEDAGFSDIRKDDYSKIPSMYTVSTAMGARRMEHEGEEPFTLIAIGVCGGKYRNEWQSNMTPGEGDIHEGFQSAAQLVIDRLAGYIATRGIEGRVKVWVSGFSRAAAVSNLVAGTLVNTGILPQEDVYAYTFATPAAVKDPPAAGYENIFNIIGPMDLVPQVMPADWDFGRYGTNLYLPVQEFSSFLGGALTEERAERDRTVYGVENNYSPALNLRLRLFFSLVLELVKSQDNYNEKFQPALVGIMQNKTVPNTLTTLQNLMKNLDEDGEEHSDLDDMMGYFSGIVRSLITHRGLDAADFNTGNAFLRLLGEHSENAYLANIGALRENMYEHTGLFHYVMVRGPVTVSLSNPYADTDDGPCLIQMTSDGQKTADETWIPEGLADTAFYLERIGDVSVIAVPSDVDYEITWTAEESGTVECLTAQCSVNASARYPGAISAPVDAAAGDTGTAFRSEDGQPVLSEDFTEKVFDGWDLAVFLDIASPRVNWRVGLMGICALLALLVCVPICAALARRPGRRGKYRFPVWLALCLMGIAALETETAFWFFADQPFVRVLWKGVVALCLIALFFMMHRPAGNLTRTLFPALLLALAADIAIVYSFMAGVALYLLCHIALILFFQRRAPLSRGKWIQWALVALPLAALIAVFYAPGKGAPGWGIVVYAPVLLLMGFSASGQPLRLRFAAILFIVSDLLLGLFIALIDDPMIHAACMLLFYTSLLLLAIDRTTADRPAGAPQPAAAEP